mgnify:CR=1 FL=1
MHFHNLFNDGEAQSGSGFLRAIVGGLLEGLKQSLEVGFTDDANRPVKLTLSRDESIRLHPKRHPITLDYTEHLVEGGRHMRCRFARAHALHSQHGMSRLPAATSGRLKVTHATIARDPSPEGRRAYRDFHHAALGYLSPDTICNGA